MWCSWIPADKIGATRKLKSYFHGGTKKISKTCHASWRQTKFCLKNHAIFTLSHFHPLKLPIPWDSLHKNLRFVLVAVTCWGAFLWITFCFIYQGIKNTKYGYHKASLLLEVPIKGRKTIRLWSLDKYKELHLICQASIEDKVRLRLCHPSIVNFENASKPPITTASNSKTLDAGLVCGSISKQKYQKRLELSSKNAVLRTNCLCTALREKLLGHARDHTINISWTVTFVGFVVIYQYIGR